MGRETRGSPASEKKLEQYGVWVKAGPREVAASTGEEEPLELSDLEGAPEAELPDITDESPLTSEEEKLLDELETEMEPDVSADADLPELTLEPEPRKSPAKDEVEVTLSDSLPMEEHFDDLQALEDELASVTGAAAAPVGGGRSDAILARIEEELRSIRTDLTELKKELSGLRKPGREPGPARQAAGEDKSGTFFDEEEDETIALTGDELDNILNTAEITEETAELAGPAAGPLRRGNATKPGLLSGADTAAPAEDILDYDTPLLEEDRLAPVQPEAGDEDILELEAEPEDAQGGDADLAADLVLEESPRPAAPSPADAFSDLELEGLPEIELEDEPAASRGPKRGAPPGQPAEMEAVEDLEAADDLEAITELEEEPVQPGGLKGPADEVDLEALALQTQDPGDTSLLELETELELAEAEPVAEDKEIRIDFEAEPAPARKPPAAKPDTAAHLPPAAARGPGLAPNAGVPEDLKEEIRSVLKYMDHLLEALPEEKIQEFAGSDYFVMYKKLFEELGLGE